MLRLRKAHKHRHGAHPRARMQRRMRAAVAVFGLALGAVSAAHAQQVLASRRMASDDRGAGPAARTVPPGTAGPTTPSEEADATGAAVAPEAIDARWRESLEAFAALDRAHAPTPGGVVFVGSSSIRLWDGLEQAFAGERAIVKRGFGGSRLADCARYVARLVIPYRPRTVVVYAGDNDLAEGATADEVLARYRSFVEQVHAALPETVIAYVSIKPSPSRSAYQQAAADANARIAAYTQGDPRLRYVDVYSRMLGADGRPRADLFLPDALHLNAAGYAIWAEAIGPTLR